MRKKFLALTSFLVFFLMIFSACSNSQDDTENVEVFGLQKAFDLAEEYLGLIKNNKLAEANALCTEELINSNNNITTGISNIVAFAPDNVIEYSNSAFMTFNVIRNSSSEPKCDLDSYAIKVVKENDEYKIDEVKATNLKQVFINNDSLRMISEDGGKSDLIISLNNITKDSYLKENKIMLYKEKVPAENFGVVALGYKGDKIAISTTSGNRSFIAIAYIQESQEAQGSSSEGNSGGEGGKNEEENLGELLEKPIAKKVIPLDIYNGAIVNNLVFMQEEEYLITEYVNANLSNRIKVYNGSSGDLIALDFDSKFPEEKYSINLLTFKKDEFDISVTAKEGSSDIDKNILGEYTVHVDSLEIKKK